MDRQRKSGRMLIYFLLFCFACLYWFGFLWCATSEGS